MIIKNGECSGHTRQDKRKWKGDRTLTSEERRVIHVVIKSAVYPFSDPYPVRVCFFAVPIVVLLTLTTSAKYESPDIMIKIVRTLVANRREVNDSLKWAARGDKLRTICKTH